MIRLDASALLVILTVSIAGAGCKNSGRNVVGKASSGGSDKKSDPGAPVAKIGTDVITQGELDAKTKGRVSRMQAEHAEQVHGFTRQALDEMIDQRLLEKKAKAENITTDQLVQREVTSKVPEPPATEVQQVYDQTKASGRPIPPFDQIKGQIVEWLKEKGTAEARKKYMEKLRAEAKVETLLPPLLLPKVTVAAEGPSKGSANAPVTIVEFSDFECPFCSRAEETVKRVMKEYEGKVRLVYRDYPLPFHSKAQKASEAALCAGDQGKYWDMHAKLFANNQALDVPQLKQHAKELGLEQGKFDQCLDKGAKVQLVKDSKKAGDEVGVTGTPAFFINGRPLSGAVPFEKFKELIDHELKHPGS